MTVAALGRRATAVSKYDDMTFRAAAGIIPPDVTIFDLL